jgi:hypothetical protein
MATLMLDAPKAQFELTIDGEKETMVCGFKRLIPIDAWVSFSATVYGPTAETTLSFPIEFARTVRIPGPCAVKGCGWMEDVDPKTGQVDGIRHRIHFTDGRTLALGIFLSVVEPEVPELAEEGAAEDDDIVPEIDDSGEEMDDDDRAQCWD